MGLKLGGGVYLLTLCIVFEYSNSMGCVNVYSNMHMGYVFE